MWHYKQPTEIRFGIGARHALSEAARAYGERVMLVTDRGLRQTEMVREILGLLGPGAALFADVEPNPTVASVDALAAQIREQGTRVVVAVGGGSGMDCAKAAASVACQEGPTRAYHSGGKVLDSRRLPLIALPTTAGTGSEVTPISVLSDPEAGVKGPINHDNFYPDLAIVDPALTITLPREVTASTGLDALAHAVEGYWSKNHQPICELMSLEAVRLVFRHLPRALADGSDLDAREGMAMAALLGGLAFQLPKNAAVHTCSYPLSSRYHLPHGTACAFTLDHFMRFNAPALGQRGAVLARAAGFRDLEEMADATAALKRLAGMPVTLADAGIPADEVEEVIRESFHPAIKNNPREVTPEDLREIYSRLATP